MSNHGKGEYIVMTLTPTSITSGQRKDNVDMTDMTPRRHDTMGYLEEGLHYRSLGSLLMFNGDSILQYLCGTDGEKIFSTYEATRSGKHTSELDNFVGVSMWIANWFSIIRTNLS